MPKSGWCKVTSATWLAPSFVVVKRIAFLCPCRLSSPVIWYVSPALVMRVDTKWISGYLSLARALQQPVPRIHHFERGRIESRFHSQGLRVHVHSEAAHVDLQIMPDRGQDPFAVGEDVAGRMLLIELSHGPFSFGPLLRAGED